MAFMAPIQGYVTIMLYITILFLNLGIVSSFKLGKTGPIVSKRRSEMNMLVGGLPSELSLIGSASAMAGVIAFHEAGHFLAVSI